MEEASPVRRRVIRRLVPLLALTLACAGPPTAGLPDGAADGRSDAGPIAPDAAVDAGEPDGGAAAPDAALDAVPDADPTANPFGIRLVDRTLGALGGPIYTGKSSDDLWGIGTGVAIGDVDGDGDLDLVAPRIDDPESTQPSGPSLLLLSDGAAPFPAFTPDAAFSALLGGVRAHAVALGDPDADGDLDVFLGCEGPDVYLENDGGGSFVDASAAAGLAGRDDDVTAGAFFADLNHDGLLDLYVANHTAQSPPYAHPRAANRLHLGLGDGTFEDVSIESHTDSMGSSQAAAAADLDGTGDLVVYVANDRFFIDGVSAFGDTTLIPPDAWYSLFALDDGGVPVFADQAAARGVIAGRSSMGVAIADVDDDLTPDVYVTDWGENELYLNATPGDPVVEAQKTLAIGARADPASGQPLVSWGARFLDLDRDGLLELVVVNGSVTEAYACDAWRQLDRYYRRRAAGEAFADVTGQVGLPAGTACGVTEPASGRGVMIGDLDGDGDDDLVVVGFVETVRIYENATPAGLHRIRVRLRGTVSSPAAIGAALRVVRPGGTAVRWQVAGGDTYGQSDAVLEVGLGDDAAPTAVEVRWPSGLVEDVTSAVVVDGEVTIVEPAWLTVAPRVVTAADPAPILTFLHPSGSAVTAVRSDGVAVTVTDLGDGRYQAPLPHPGVARSTVITLTVDGSTLRPRPRVVYR